MTWNPLRRRYDRARRRIALVFLALPEDRHYGYPLSKQVGMSPGAIYPALTRLEADGWITSGWDDFPEDERRRQRWYMVTNLGHREMTALLRGSGGTQP